MRHVITMTHCRRPEYSKQVLDALRNCVGIEKYTIVAHVEPGGPVEVWNTIKSIDFAECVPVLNSNVLGISMNTFEALRHGFSLSDVDFVIHIEDDTVPSKDALAYFEWGAETYKADLEILNISGFVRTTQHQENPYLVHRIPYFSSWGWGTWRDRWEEPGGMLETWNDYAWDVHIYQAIRRDRKEISAYQSRIQNIGRLGGTNMGSDYWEQWANVPAFIPDLEPGPYEEISA